jgi:MFS family permease
MTSATQVTGGRAAPSATRIGLIYGAFLFAPAASQGAPAVAIATIGRELGLVNGATAWVLASFALAMALAMPVAGRMIERGGTAGVLARSTLLLVVGGVTSAIAPDLGVLILGRVLAGAGTGAAFVATYQGINTVVAADERPRSLAVVASAVSIASGCGPLIGGALETAFGWRAVVALPVLALVMVVTGVQRVASRTGSGAELDWRGAVLLSVTGAGLLTLLQARGTQLTTPIILLVLGVVVLACAGLVIHIRRVPGGFVPLEVIQAPGFAVTSFIAFAAFAAYFALLFAVPMTARTVHGWSGPAVGLALTPAVLTGVIATRWFAGQARRATAASTLAIPLAGAIGLAIVAVALSSPVALIAGLACAIVGFAGTQVVLVARIAGLVPPAQRPAAIGLFNFVALAGGACGPATVGALLAVVPMRTAFVLLAVLPIAAAIVAVTQRARAGRAPSRRTV